MVRPLLQIQDLHTTSRVERALERAIDGVARKSGPRTLHAAMRHAVFPGGQRLRPALTLFAAASTGDPRPEVTDAAAVAIELMHCASLVHDDMPCFDDADVRRGLPTVHAKYGEALALLVGDGLIVVAFERLARVSPEHARLVPDLVSTLAIASGPTRGIVAGQAWECEAAAPLAEYHRAKTASLFEAAAELGAISAGADRKAWAAFGEAFGRAYQAIDDLRDATSTQAETGKPVGRDEALGRPSLVRSSGIVGARARLRQQFEAARAAVPHGGDAAAAWLDQLGRRFVK